MDDSKDHQKTFEAPLSRRSVLQGAGMMGVAALAGSPGQVLAEGTAAVNHTIRIAPISLEIAPNKIIKTTAYNGTVPGPTLRLQEGKPVAIKVINDSGYPNIVHWHGFFIPSVQDGAMEEGSPIIPASQSLIYAFTPKPNGTRWYHSHAMAMANLNRSTYTGEFGFVIVEPANDPGRYDREVLLAARRWEGSWISMQDFIKRVPANNGLEVMYHSATFGERMLGHGEPVRVRQGEQVLFRLLNASPTMPVSLALPGHRFTVIALDGNPVPTQATVDTLTLDVAERADVIVEMNNPGVWVFGSTDPMDRNMGMGIVVEYENYGGEARWISPANAAWDYTVFGRPAALATPDETISLKFEKIPGGRGRFNRWTINGKSWPETNRLFTVEQGKRYRLLLNNNSGDTHPVHLHRHNFEITKIGDTVTSGVMKDTISMPRFTTAEVDFVADDPGPTMLHCHHQDHLDEGFAGVFTYA
ncbi:MAG TPA: multicopper oxidase family protein [Acidocella sp.]|jgi:FtsP/CotA-like multicopper oxidase with cupredoxin domain|uniref:multicopper oxidase family protein n=1 Tax=Acidocella sp. TaxID=50710 RepID=UPI002B9AB282|nr:multicopper oxidase family protein [Acidocella sp.]HVE21185.1 multicopper oxidase family protein [Acidocella sp.]